MASAAVAMNPKAWMKSANLYSLWSFPETTVHPLRTARAFFSSGSENFRMLLLSFASIVPAYSRLFRSGRDFSLLRLLPPLRGLLRLAPRLVELHKPLASPVQVVAVRDCDLVFPGHHSLVSRKQKWLSVGVLLLSSQAGAQQALGEESLPALQPFRPILFDGLAGQGFAQSELSLRLVSHGQVCHIIQRVRITWTMLSL